MIKDPYQYFLRKVVVIFNLGGPGSIGEIKPFLFNLFYDKSIINLPNPIRYILAKLISSKRNETATEIYKSIGGGSPILELTNLQADLLQEELSRQQHVYNGKNISYDVLVAMRYTNPSIYDIISKLKEDLPDEIILLPLYPQYSSTTTGSFFREWEFWSRKLKLDVQTRRIHSYPCISSFIKAHANLIKESIQCKETTYGEQKYRLLFSAHSLPQRVINNGDPYQAHVEKNIDNIIRYMKIPNIDYRICYQSKVGRSKWLEPSISMEIEKAKQDNVGIIVVPISFVSENSETLFELDIQYKEFAKDLPFYIRTKALNMEANFISALKDMVIGVDKINIISGHSL